MLAYSRAILALGPTGYWPLDDWIGTVAPDRSPVGVNGTLLNTMSKQGGSPIQGDAQKSAQFTNGLIEIADHVAHRPPELTVMAWIYPTASQGDRGVFVKSSSGALSDGWGLYIRSAQTMTWYVNNYNAGSTVVIFDTPRLNEWQFYVGTFRPGQVLGYYNGRLHGSNTDTSISSSTQTIRIGNYPSGFGFVGHIAHCALFPRAISGADVGRLYALGRGMGGPHHRHRLAA